MSFIFLIKRFVFVAPWQQIPKHGIAGRAWVYLQYYYIIHLHVSALLYNIVPAVLKVAYNIIIIMIVIMIIIMVVSLDLYRNVPTYRYNTYINI